MVHNYVHVYFKWCRYLVCTVMSFLVVVCSLRLLATTLTIYQGFLWLIVCSLRYMHTCISLSGVYVKSKCTGSIP